MAEFRVVSDAGEEVKVRRLTAVVVFSYEKIAGVKLVKVFSRHIIDDDNTIHSEEVALPLGPLKVAVTRWLAVSAINSVGLPPVFSITEGIDDAGKKSITVYLQKFIEA